MQLKGKEVENVRGKERISLAGDKNGMNQERLARGSEGALPVGVHHNGFTLFFIYSPITNSHFVHKVLKLRSGKGKKGQR